jgi:hypothetical protein
MGSMTRKHISTPDITAGITDPERLLSLAPPGAASAERAVSSLPFDAACCGTLRHGRGRGCRLSQFMRRRANTSFTKTRTRNSTYICGGSLIDTGWIACSSRMRQANTTTRLDREVTIIPSTPCTPRTWKRGVLTIGACIPYSRYSQLR